MIKDVHNREGTDLKVDLQFILCLHLLFLFINDDAIVVNQLPIFPKDISLLFVYLTLIPELHGFFHEATLHVDDK